MELIITLAVIGGIFFLAALVAFGAIVFAYPVAFIADFKNAVKNILDNLKAKREAKKAKKETTKEVKETTKVVEPEVIEPEKVEIEVKEGE